MMDYLKQAKIRGKTMRFPVYFPDATRAVIRSLDSHDLQEAKIEGLILNPYHLMSQPSINTIKKFKGVKQYMNWPGFVITDSGGWQLLSLVHKDKKFGKITNKGVVFYKDSLGENKKLVFTPEKSIQLQFDIGADIIICLDDCPGKNASKKETGEAVDRTILWAQKCKTAFQKMWETRSPTSRLARPLLFSVIQGGNDLKLRTRCAKELVRIGFDGYGWGGWTADETGRLDLKIAKFIIRQLPPKSIKFALGVGYPWDIIDCAKLGYHIFDCVIPTRDARHQRLYVWTKNPEKTNIKKVNSRKLFNYFYPGKKKYANDPKPIDQFCDCRLCRNHSRAYLRHLFKIGDALAWRLASIHNLRIYTKLIEVLRKNVK